MRMECPGKLCFHVLATGRVTFLVPKGLGRQRVWDRLCGGLLAAPEQYIFFSTADGNADGMHREEMSARERHGLLSHFIDTRQRQLIHILRILGVGQKANGVSNFQESDAFICWLLVG